MSNKKPALILFGGTFSPIHIGHIEPVLQAAQVLNAELVTYLPCHLPPHKTPPKVTSEHRLKMTELALAKVSSPVKLMVSDHEIQQRGLSYTRYTVEHFAKSFPDHDIYFLIGMDSLLSFDTWYKWQEILEFCKLLVMKRPGYPTAKLESLPDNLTDKFGSRVIFTDASEVAISSSEIRARLDNEETRIPELPDVVFDYIKRHQLYR